MPELIKKSAKRSEKKRERKIYLCNVGRTETYNITFNLMNDGYVKTEDYMGNKNLTRDEILSWYESRKGIDKKVPDESFAIVRHPIGRIESHVKWAVYYGKTHRKENGFFDFINYSIDNLFEEDFCRNIVPAFDSILFDATVFQYELGVRRISDFFVENKIVEKWTRIVSKKDEESLKVDWSKCPDSLRDKILKTYDQDFEAFDYDPDDYFKA